MRAVISKVFFDHPASVEESYFEHLIFSGTVCFHTVSCFAGRSYPCHYPGPVRKDRQQSDPPNVCADRKPLDSMCRLAGL